MYFNRLKHSKIVISDFHLAKLEKGLIKDPCGTPEYLGRGWVTVVINMNYTSFIYRGLYLNSTHVAVCCVCFPSAPEVVGRQRYGRPVDCWAIGVIMYIL